MDTKTVVSRNKEKAEWLRFVKDAPGLPRVKIAKRYRELIESGNWHALEFERQLVGSRKSGMSQPSFWGNSDNGLPVDSSGGGKCMPYSGLHKE